jgi:hypothetical protein
MPKLRTAIIEGLHHWRDPTKVRQESSSHDIRLAVAQQDNIGWQQFINGHLGYRWKGIQQEYLEFLARRNTGKKWVRELIKKLWGVAWDMWEHRNDILHTTLTPAKLRRIEDLNTKIQRQLKLGQGGLLPRNLHWLQAPETVLRYDLDLKAQWLESIVLARERFLARREINHEAMRNQRELLTTWLAGPT